MYHIPISHSKVQTFRKVRFRGYCAAATNDCEVIETVEQIKRGYPSLSCVNSPFAYRYRNIKRPDEVCEGSNDGNEFGAGEKLLHLLQKWDVRNVVVAVGMESNIAFSGRLGSQRFRIILDCAKQVLERCFLEFNTSLSDESESEFEVNTDSTSLTTYPTVQMNGKDSQLASKTSKTGKRTAASAVQIQNLILESDALPKNQISDADISPYIEERNANAVGAKSFISKRNLAQLKSVVRPNELLFLLMQCVGLLLSHDDLSWEGLKELIHTPGFPRVLSWPTVIFQNPMSEEQHHALCTIKDVLINQIPTLDEVSKSSSMAAEIHHWLVVVLRHFAEITNDSSLVRAIQQKYIPEHNLASGSYRLAGQKKVSARLAYADRQKQALEAHHYRREQEEKGLRVLDEFVSRKHETSEQFEERRKQRQRRLEQKAKESRRVLGGVVREYHRHELPLVLVNNKVHIS